MEEYQLKINSITQTVNYFDGQYCTNNMGKWEELKSQIFISDSLTDEVKFQTIIHELCHVFFRNSGLRDGDDEERIVQGMSVQMYDFIINNREFIVDLINNSAKK